MEELKKALNGLLSTAYEMDEPGVASLYKEDGSDLKPEAFEIIKQKDIERVAKLKPDTKKIQDDWYKKGQSETLSKLEKDIKAKFGVQSDKMGVELIEEIVSAAGASKGQGSNLTEADVKKHAVYLDLIEQKNALEKDVKEKYIPKDEFETYKSGIERDKVFQAISQKALTMFEGFKPILSSDPEKAANQKNLLVSELSRFKYRIDGDKVVVVNEDGTDHQDGHGNRVPFEKLVKSTADKYFEYQAAEDRSGANNIKKPGDGGKLTYTFKSDEDFMQQMQQETDPLKRAAMSESRVAARKST